MHYDNDEAMMKSEREQWDSRLLTAIAIQPPIKVEKTIAHSDYTLFVLSPHSRDHLESLKTLIQNKKRYSIENATLAVNIAEEEKDDDPDSLSNYTSRLPVKKSTLAIKRKALVALPRSLLRTCFYQTVLASLFLALLYTLYHVVL